MSPNCPKIILITTFLLLFFAQETTAQFVSFPQEPMLSRIQKIAEWAQKNAQSITYETRFLEGVTARAFTSASVDVEDWLRMSVEDTPLAYRKINRSRFVVFRSIDTPAASGTLAGKITDAFGTPLAGATVWLSAIGKGTATGMNGDYALTLAAGIYAAEIRFLGFEPMRVEQIEIGNGQTTRLDAALQETKIALHEIEIGRKLPENVIAGALRAQRNTPYISTVLSNQEINRSAANSVRDALKLVSGMEVTENDGLIVRGAGGRWNAVLLDGTPLPNYDPSHKLFSFDLLPLAAVDNIRLLQSATPDIPATFGNAATEIITKDIPEQNFVQLTAEASIHAQSTFHDQRTRRRGRLDFIGFDDGSRETATAFPPEHFGIRDQKTPPSQRYVATIGRAYTADNQKNRFGLIFSVSYGNTQRQTAVHHTVRGRWKNMDTYTGSYGQTRNSGHIYGYQTTMGGMLNAGWQRGKNRVSFRNVFSRNFENNLTEIAQHLEDIDYNEQNISHQFFNYPTFSSLIQNKLEGQHGAKNTLLRWNVSHTFVRRERKDAAFSEVYKPMRDDSLVYFLHHNPALKTLYPASSGWYHNTERDFWVGVSATFPFQWKSIKSNVTIGYNGSFGNIRYAYRERLHRYNNKSDIDNPEARIYQEIIQDEYRKTAIRNLPFVMLEHRWGKALRLVWGVQGNYENSARKWYAPSANVSFAPVSNVNVRASYQYTFIRPQLVDYVPFPVYDTHLLGTSVNRPVEPSFVQSLDFRVEKYASTLDLFSFGLFYRDIRNPIERTTFEYRHDERMYILQNSDRARHYGFEIHVRKHLDFFNGNDWLRKTQLTAGYVFTRSSVHGKRMRLITHENGDTKFKEIPTTQTRPLSGQMPYQFNAGIRYADNKLFVNVLFNRSGRQLFLLGENAHAHEYRASFNSLEANIGYRFPKSGILLKLSGSNLLKAHEIFYTNTPVDYVRDEYNFPTDNLLPRKTENYDKGRDPIVHKTRGERTITFSASGTF